jgi:hypothetical protein
VTVKKFTLLLLLAAPALAQPSPVTVALSPAGPTVGDRVQATITLRVPADRLSGEPRFPAWGKTWGEAVVVAHGEPVRRQEGGTAVYEQTVTLAAFRPGPVPLPPVAVAVPMRAGTVRAATPAGLAVTVRSVLPPDEKDPKPKKEAPPRHLAWGERFWWALAGLLAACLLAAALLWRRRRNAVEAPAPVPALPPFEELAAALDRLAAEKSMLSFHTQLSLAVRRYLGRRLPFPALESTTFEVQRQLLSRRMPPALVRPLGELLWACDLVKFANRPASEPQARERADTARRLAADLEAHLAPRAPERLEATG